MTKKKRKNYFIPIRLHDFFFITFQWLHKIQTVTLKYITHFDFFLSFPYFSATKYTWLGYVIYVIFFQVFDISYIHFNIEQFSHHVTIIWVFSIVPEWAPVPFDVDDEHRHQDEQKDKEDKWIFEEKKRSNMKCFAVLGIVVDTSTWLNMFFLC